MSLIFLLLLFRVVAHSFSFLSIYLFFLFLFCPFLFLSLSFLPSFFIITFFFICYYLFPLRLCFCTCLNICMHAFFNILPCISFNNLLRYYLVNFSSMENIKNAPRLIGIARIIYLENNRLDLAILSNNVLEHTPTLLFFKRMSLCFVNSLASNGSFTRR